MNCMLSISTSPFSYITCWFIWLHIKKEVTHKCGKCCPILCWQVHANVDNAWNEEEVWRVEMYVSFGIMSFGLMSLLAITSIPSINSKLNWREFSFIQVELYTKRKGGHQNQKEVLIKNLRVMF